jgi:hypothetical protein
MPLNIWTKFDLHVITAGSGLSTLQVYMNNVQVVNTSTANVGTAGILNVQLGNETKTQLYTLFADNIVVAGPGSAFPTPTSTAMPPTATSTSVPPTATLTAPTTTPSLTFTPVPPTATSTSVPATATPLFTNTPEPPTATALPTNTPTETSVPTATPVSPSLFTDGFESGDFSAWTITVVGGDGSAVVQSSPAYNGNFSAKFSETGNTGSLAYIRKSLFAPETSLKISGDFMIAQEGVSGGNIPIFRVFDSSGTRLLTLYRQNLTNGQIWSYDNTTRIQANTLMPLNIWMHFDLYVITNGTGASTIEVYMNGVRVIQTTTANLGSSGVFTVQIGNDTSKQISTMFADDIVIQK